jgi:hypothetical protein
MTNQGCYEVTFSIFGGLVLASGDGGAIYTGGYTVMYISDSTFDDCCSSEGAGGAIAAYGSNMEGFRCCFQACEAKTYGLAIHFQGGADPKSFADSNFYNCSNDLGGEGLLRLNVVLMLQLDRLNITGTNQAGKEGAALRVEAGSFSNPWTLSYSTICKCIGASALSHWGYGQRPVVQFCNVYNSTASVNLIRVNVLGLTLDHCILFGNAESAEFGMATPGGYGYQLFDCVLDGSAPDSGILAALENVQTNSVTDSFDLARVTQCNDPTASQNQQTTDPFTLPGSLRYGEKKRVVQAFGFLFMWRFR